MVSCPFSFAINELPGRKKQMFRIFVGVDQLVRREAAQLGDSGAVLEAEVSCV